MKYRFFAGIDVSKEKLDISVIEGSCPEIPHHYEIPNTPQAFKKLIVELKGTFGKPGFDWLFCLEHTGVYAVPMCQFLSKQGLNYALIPALQIQRSVGMRRGKNDKTDSRDIARYAMLFAAEIKLYSLPDPILSKLQVLLGQRERLVKCCVMMKSSRKEQTAFLDKQMIKETKLQSDRIINTLHKEIEKLDGQMQELISSSEKVKDLYKLITSVPGIGPQTALNLMVVTRCFTTFDNARQLASYCGVAPFEYSSGKSIKGKTKVSPLANKRMKSLLSMCALNAKANDPQIAQYYQRKINEGKNPMSVINAVKNKLLLRLFATVQRGTPYVKLQYG
jgi:transposase